MGRFAPKLTGRALFPCALDLVLRARLELARRPRLRRAVPRPGIGEAFGVAARRPQAVVIGWSAAAVAVFYSLWSLALALLFITRLRILDDRPSARVTLVLPATGALPGLEDLLDALAAQSLAAQPADRCGRVDRRSRLLRASRPWPSVYPRLNIELVVAGLSPLRSQKCTNLLAALAHLDRRRCAMSFCSMPISGRSPGGWRCWSRRWLPGAPISSTAIAGRCRRRSLLGAVLAAAIDRAIAVLPRLRQDEADMGRLPRGHPPRARHARSAEYDRPNPDRGPADRRPRRARPGCGC